MIGVAEQQLSKLPRMEPARREMTDTTLETLRQFLRQRPEDPEAPSPTVARFQKGPGHRRLCSIR
jgi:hypothetical protein